MSQYNDTGYKAFTAGGAIAQYLRVKLSSGKLAAAGLGDAELGTITEAAFASGDIRNVSLCTKQGTQKMVAGAAISLGDEVYGAASGKISSTDATGSVTIGVALEAASGDGSVIEVLRQ